MADEQIREVKVFYCYAREDKSLRDELEKHLSNLKRQFKIVTWHDREISPGVEWAREIDFHLKYSDIILILISPDFMASDYCYGIELKEAMERQRLGEARVIPILLRPVDWENAPFSELQVLPSDGKFITTYQNKDEALLEVTLGIRKVVKEHLLQQYREWALAHAKARRYERALEYSDQVICLDPNDAEALQIKGRSLKHLKRSDEALMVYQEVIRLKPADPDPYIAKVKILKKLKRFEEALEVCEQAFRLKPDEHSLYILKGEMLEGLERYEEALLVYERALELRPRIYGVYFHKGRVLENLKRGEEALAAYAKGKRLMRKDDVWGDTPP